jgi:hypothetical protein
MVGHYRTPTGEYFPTHGPVRTDTAGGWTKMSDEPLAREREPMSACGRALRPWLWRTLLPAAVLDPSGQASPVERQPCRTAGARFTAAVTVCHAQEVLN